MKPKVYLARAVPPEVEEYIGQHCEYRKWQGGVLTQQRLMEEIQDAEGLMITGLSIDAKLLDSAPRLKVVSNISVGYNNFDIEAMRARKVIGTHTPHVLDETVADLVFGLMLAAARRIPELDKYVKEGKWSASDGENLFGVDVHSTTLGIIGMGRIGEAIARRAILGFKMDVLYYNRRRKPETEEKFGVKYADLSDLLRQSDFIVLMLPLNADTKHFIGKNEFAMMKNSAIFINASRGQTVDEQALIEALQNGTIRAAGLDVFAQEPINPDNPLLKLPNVVTVPHIGSATARTRFDMAMLAAQNLVAGVTGKRPPNVVEELRDLVE